MKDRPILFSAPMVRAILDGSKTQTRRVVKPQFAHDAVPAEMCAETPEGWQTIGHSGLWWCDAAGAAENAIRCPYGIPGDRLWVRETWQHSNHPFGSFDDRCHVFYRADYLDDPHGPDGEKSPEGKYRHWNPSIHMPRAASRINLEVTGIRVERLQDISEEDAWNEGVQDWMGKETPWKGRLAPVSVHAYATLWEQINGAGSWDANPWVWVVEFRRL